MISAYLNYKSRQISLEKILRLAELAKDSSFQLLIIYTHKKDYDKVGDIIENNFTKVETGSSRVLYIHGDVRIQLEEIDYYV